jgi:hypothetical protein
LSIRCFYLPSLKLINLLISFVHALSVISRLDFYWFTFVEPFWLLLRKTLEIIFMMFMHTFYLVWNIGPYFLVISLLLDKWGL